MKDLNHERLVLLLALVAGLPGSAVALLLLWRGDYTSKVVWTFTVLIVVFWVGFAAAARRRVIYPLQTLSNLLAAMREEDFSVRAREAPGTKTRWAK